MHLEQIPRNVRPRTAIALLHRDELYLPNLVSFGVGFHGQVATKNGELAFPAASSTENAAAQRHVATPE